MPHTQFKIRHHSPWQTPFMIVGGIVFLVVCFFSSYKYGMYAGDQVKDKFLAKEQKMDKQADSLFKTNQRLIASNTMLERSGKIDRQALEQNEEALRRVKTQFHDLKKELSFYKSLVTPSDIQRGVQIKSFNVKKIELSEKYSGKLVLMQSKNNRYVSGTVSLTIDGLSAGTVKTIGLEELIGLGKKTLKFKFKYFQNMKMDLTLPEDFIPSSVIIKVTPKGRKMRPFEKIYNWAKINS